MKTIDRLREDWLLATEINKLEARLWRLVRRENMQTILVTSAVRGEGKSTTVAFLATSMGLYPGRRILAIDFDFRIPTLNTYFDTVVTRGIDSVLEGRAPLPEAIIETELPSLHLALPTPGGSDPGLLLRTQELVNTISSLREAYDLILLDSPAILPVADATMLMPFADGVIITAMAGKTTEPQLKRATEICEGMDANILGLVVGNIQEAAPEYLADDYSYYGYHGDLQESEPSPAPSKSSASKSKK
jgi:capsular exopolysaccharide synthesis family protein